MLSANEDNNWKETWTEFTKTSKIYEIWEKQGQSELKEISGNLLVLYVYSSLKEATCSLGDESFIWRSRKLTC